MDIIRKLINEKYILINTDINKSPKGYSSGECRGIKGWQKMSYNDLLKEHNYDSNLWGIRLGKQKNDKFIISLDFDICGEQDKITKLRVKSIECENYFNEYFNNIDRKDGLYKSSTQGNYNLLIDISSCPLLLDKLINLNTDKFDPVPSLEFKIKNFQIIPPSVSTCKITGKIGEPREFLNDKQFYVLSNNTFLYKYLFNLIDLKYDDKKIIKKIKIKSIKNLCDNEISNMTYNENIEIIKQMEHKKINIDEINELSKLIKIEDIDNYTSWLKIIWSLKSIDAKDIAINISKRSNKYNNDDEFNKYYNNCKEQKINIGTFYFYCKNGNELKYFEIRNKYDEVIGDTDMEIGKFFVKFLGDNFIYNEKNLYCFNGIYWKINPSKNKLKKALQGDLVNIYMNKQKLILDLQRNTDNEEKIEIYKNNIKKISGIITKLYTEKNMINVLNNILTYIENEDIKFDTKPNLFVFENAIYDLHENNFIQPNKYDYCSISTGYEYIKPLKDDIDYLNNVFNMVHSIEEEKKLYLTLLSTGLYGQTLENFILANGSGRNGKGMTNELCLKTMGNYGYTCANSILSNSLKVGSNPEIANMNNKRIIFYREPSTNDKLNIGIIKELTGGNEINARLNHSNNTTTQLKGTHILECNEKPNLSGEITDAIVKRIIDYPFRSSFTNKEDEIDEENLIFKGDNNVKSDEFKEKYKIAFFHILIEYWKEYCNNEKNIERFITDNIRLRTNDYLKNGSELKTWFDENYKQSINKETNEINLTDVLKISEVYKFYVMSDFYQKLSKKEQREITLNKFTEKIQNNIFFKKFYKADERNKEICDKYGVSRMRNILKGFVVGCNNEDDE